MRVASSPAPVAGSPVSPEPRPRPNPALPRRPARAGPSPLPSPTRGAEPCSTIPTSCTSWSPIVTARPVRWPPRDEGAASTVRCSGLAGVTAGEPHPSRSLTGANDTHRRPARITRDRGAERVPGTTVRRMPTRQRPDRNLALELVRVTEAAALAASRWMGRGDKNGADGAAVDAMRIVLAHACRWTASSSSARARRTKRRCSSTASRSATARARRPTSPSTRSTAPRSRRSGRGNAIAVIAGRERGTMFDPGPVRLHGEDRRRARSAPASIDINASRRPRTSQAVAKAKGESGPRRHRRDPRPRPPRRPHRRGPRGRRPHPAHPRRRRRRRHLHRLARLRRRHPVRHRRHPRGRHHRRRAQVHGRRDPGSALAPQRRRARRGRSPPATTSTRCSPPTTSSPATTASSPPPASPTASCSRASTTTPGGATTQSLVMRSKSGTVRLDQRPPPARQAAGLRGRRLRLASSPSSAALRLAPTRFARQCLGAARGAPAKPDAPGSGRR